MPTVQFKFAHVLRCSVRWIAQEDSSLCNLTQMNLSARDRLRLERERCQREQEGRRSERTDVRQARQPRQPRFDRRHVHSEESVAFSGSIIVELHSEGSIVSTCTEHFEDVTSLIH